MKLDKEFYSQIFESETMAQHLAHYSIEPRRIAEAVLLSPVSLLKKQRILTELSKMPGGDAFKDYLEELSYYIDRMHLKQGEILLLFEQFWGENEELASPCASWDDLSDRVKKNTEQLREDLSGEEPLVSYIAEKWGSDGRCFKKKAEYIIANGEVCGFRSIEFDSRQNRFPMLGGNAEVNLPVPFAPGDTVLICCAPFAPPQRAVVLELGNNPYDSRFPHILYYHPEKRVWKTESVKNKFIFSDSILSPLSPLYKIDYAPKPLTGESENISKRLKAVSEYIRGSEETARKLFNSIFNFKCGENDGSKAYITKERLVNFLNEAC